MFPCFRALDRLHRIMFALVAVLLALLFSFLAPAGVRVPSRIAPGNLPAKRPPAPAVLGSVPAFNYEDRAFVPHAPVFANPFSAALQTMRLFDPLYVSDFLGTRTAYAWDCTHKSPYLTFHKSRVVPCSHHTRLIAANFSGWYVPLSPIVDEEYLEWVDMLSSVAHFHRFCPQGAVFTAVELGARYGTWIARAGSAVRNLRPSAALKLVGVEADKLYFSWMKEHFRNNNFTAYGDLRMVAVGKSQGSMDFVYDEASEAHRIPVDTLHSMLRSLGRIDYLDLDIQGIEYEVFTDEALELLSSRARFVHIGTHHGADPRGNGEPEHNNRLIARFGERGWEVISNVVDRMVRPSEYGSINYWGDGVLSFSNRRFLDDC